MKILSLVDGSACSGKAIEYVVSHQDSFLATERLRLLHIEPPVPGGLAKSIAGIDAINSYYETNSRTALAPAEKILQEREIPYQSDYVVGDTADQVQTYVTKHGIELIVMGSHGHGGLKSFIMGSVATKVLTTATVPVLIVR